MPQQGPLIRAHNAAYLLKLERIDEELENAEDNQKLLVAAITTIQLYRDYVRNVLAELVAIISDNDAIYFDELAEPEDFSIIMSRLDPSSGMNHFAAIRIYLRNEILYRVAAVIEKTRKPIVHLCMQFRLLPEELLQVSMLEERREKLDFLQHSDEKDEVAAENISRCTFIDLHWLRNALRGTRTSLGQARWDSKTLWDAIESDLLSIELNRRRSAQHGPTTFEEAFSEIDQTRPDVRSCEQKLRGPYLYSLRQAIRSYSMERNALRYMEHLVFEGLKAMPPWMTD